MDNEPTRRSKPVEQVSLSIPFFVVALAFFLFSIWAVYDELVSRRVWKDYQAQFDQIEATRLSDEVQQELTRLSTGEEVEIEGAEEKLPSLPVIQKNLAQARAVLETDEYKALAEQIKALDRELYLATLQWKIAKSRDVEHAFSYGEAVKHREEAHPGAQEEVKRYRAKLDQDAEHIAHWDAELDRLKAEKEKISGQRDQLLSDVTKWEELEKTVTRKLAILKDKLKRLDKPPLVPDSLLYEGSIQQIVLRGYQRDEFGESQYTVDRCQTCHYAANKAGYEKETISLSDGSEIKVPLVLRTHPDRDSLLAQHPVKKFACVTCHYGQGVAVSSTSAGHSDLDEAHGTLEFWDHPVLGFVRSGEFHDYEHEREPNYTQATCFKCHSSQYEIESPHAELLNAGKEYVTRLGCWSCHNMTHVGDGAIGYTGKKVAPSLLRVGYKLGGDWIVSWVDNPQAHLTRSRMPQYEDFGDPATKQEDLKDVAAFLLSQSEEKGWDEYDRDHRPESFFRSGQATRGKKLFGSIGCQGCHAMGGHPKDYAEEDNLFYRDYDVAPDLYNTGNKIRSAKWIYHWIRNPQGYDPDSPMPSLRLSEQEALDITAYLIAQKGKAIPQVPGLDETLGDEKAIAHGQWVVRTYGCYGCHNIRGFENEGKLSVELSSFANKQPYELSFGYRVDVPHTWEDWTFAKLRNPRGFHTERQLSKMPNFHLSKEGAAAIRILLKSFTGERVGREWYRDLGPEDLAVEEGRVLLEQYNCKGCHVIDSKGGRILAYYKDPNQGPPQLYGEGARVQPDWLFGFLLGPTKIRQGLDVRMPTFPLSQEKASKIVRYFQGKAGNLDPFINVDVTDLDPNLIVKGKDLFYNMYRCQQCHFLKDRYSDAEKVQVGPNLKLAHEKLRPEWMRQWIANPGKIIPGVRMPTFFYLEEDEHGRPILDPSNEYAAAALPQIEALRAYVLVYGRDKEVLRRIREKQRKKLSMR